MKTEIKKAIDRSVSHNEIVHLTVVATNSSEVRREIEAMVDCEVDSVDIGNNTLDVWGYDENALEGEMFWRLVVTCEKRVTVGEWGWPGGSAGHIVCSPANRDAVQEAYDAIEEGDLSSDALSDVYAAGGEFVPD